jgi:opacity protein-like surface antigen
LHDGFFLRLALGGGRFHDSASSTAGPSSTSFTAQGGSTAFELSIGGTPTPGFIVAGTLLGHSVPSPTIEMNGGKFDGNSSSVSMLGLMLDGYPDPRGGFHIGGVIGFASISDSTINTSSTSTTSTSSDSTSGLGIAPHIGYEWWVSDNWALGAQFRFFYGTMKDDAFSITTKHSVTLPSLSFVATYN